jgi:hypothetical protein
MIKSVAKSVLLCLAIAGFGLRTFADASTASEYEVKAAFLYNFIKFVEWPPKAFPSQNSPLIIGILGDDPFFSSATKINYLDQTVNGKTINDRKIVVQRSNRLADLKNCHLLFISKSERNRVKDTLANLSGLNILLVSETDNFCQQGGAINFVMQAEKVRFEINVDAAEKAGLKISSKLLNVAKIIVSRAK